MAHLNSDLQSFLKLEEKYIKSLQEFKSDMDSIGIEDITVQQLIILLKIGESHLPVKTILKKAIGSNPNHNILKLVKRGYVKKKESELDGRSSIINLTPKGIKVYEKFSQ